MAQINAGNRVTLILIGVALLLLIALNVFITRWITTPLLRLNKAAQLITAGNEWRLISGENRIIELDSLRISFNEMIKQVQQTLNDLNAEITQRKLTEKALRGSERRYRALFEHAGDAIHISNEKDELIDANSRLCQMTGYSRETLLTMRVSDLQAPEVRRPAAY